MEPRSFYFLSGLNALGMWTCKTLQCIHLQCGEGAPMILYGKDVLKVGQNSKEAAAL